MKKLLLSSLVLVFVSVALYSLGAGQANQNNFTLFPNGRWPNFVTSIPSSDQLAQTVGNGIGSFATTQTIPSNGLGVGSLITIRGRGIYTSTATASPLLNLRVTAGGTTGICPAAAAAAGINTGQTNASWWLECYIQIATTGSSGTAWTWGTFRISTTAGVETNIKNFTNTGTATYNTTAGTVATIDQTATMVSGQTMNLQAFTVGIDY